MIEEKQLVGEEAGISPLPVEEGMQAEDVLEAPLELAAGLKQVSRSPIEKAVLEAAVGARAAEMLLSLSGCDCQKSAGWRRV